MEDYEGSRFSLGVNIEALPKIMLNIAQARSVDQVLQQIVNGIAQCHYIVLARIWLVRPGDRCSSCRFESECFRQAQCLHLVASAGNPVDETVDYERVDGAFARFPMGVRKIGRVASTGQPFLSADLRGDEDWIADTSWMRREGVRTVAAQPLIFRGEVMGVLGIFDRVKFDEEQLQWLRLFADHAAVSLANARALEEIQNLRARLEDENTYLREEMTTALGTGDIVGRSAALRKVMHQIHLVAGTNATVLIAGESGTGKELVARAIHENSARRQRALIKVNCGAVPENLFESEFFGHVKGAFTGALKDRPGRFELADGGTLFLDEIGEIPLAMQAKLLRVLQEQELERVGDTRTRRVDARIIAATNRDLAKEVEEGRFRQDLYYRLGVFPVDVPPLRERREDIPMLVMHFMKAAARRMHRPTPRISQAAMRQFADYDWPGNVRELQNVVERGVILSGEGPLRLELPAMTEGREASRREPMATEDRQPGYAVTSLLTREELKRQERENIRLALAQAEGKVFGRRGAAVLLGMKPTTLSSRIKALGINRHAG